MVKKKKLSKGWIAVIIGVSVLAITGIAVGVLAMNGVFDSEDNCPVGTYRYSCPLPEDSMCPCLTTEEHEKETERPFVVKKPIIYLYPKTETEVLVGLGYPEKLSVSYPKYKNGWKVLAKPDGSLKDLDTGRELYSLYWEGEDGGFEVTNEGFVVKGEEATEFLEEKLAILGLNAREAEEFIIYWLPKMQENEFNYARFASEAEIAEYMPLKVSPEPDTTIRVMMVLAEVDENFAISEQVLKAVGEREGFVVVEWGGSLVE